MQINIIDTILHLSDICYSLNEDTLKHENLSRAESFALLSINPGEIITGSELAVKNRLSPSRMSRIVDQLVEKGLILRAGASSDRRFIKLRLSEQGIQKHNTLKTFRNSCEQKIVEQLHGDELNIVADGLNILANAMEK